MSRDLRISILGAGWLGEPLGVALQQAGWVVKASTTQSDKLARLTAKGLHPFLIRVEEGWEAKAVEDFFATDILFVNIPPGRRFPDVESRFPKQIEWIIENAERVAQPNYIFVSSTSVYGAVQGIVKEDTPLQPTTASGRALVAAEQYLQQQVGRRLTILRLAGLVGGDRRPGKWFAGKQDLPGGQLPVNLVHRQDCLALIQAVIRQQYWGAIFNICADQHPTKRELYPHQARKDGLIPPTYLATEAEPGGKIVSNEAIKQQLGFQFQFPNPMDF